VIAAVPEPVAGDVVEGKTGDSSAVLCDGPSELEALRAQIQSLEEENVLLHRSMAHRACCLPHPDPDVKGDPLKHRHPACHEFARTWPWLMQEITEELSELCSRLGHPVASVGDSTSVAP
jgi:hypothetical protein